jgi:methyl-accepting chemotaxis protein
MKGVLVRIRTKIFMVVCLGFVTGIASAGILASRIKWVVSSYRSLFVVDVAQTEEALHMQVTFKKQVQAWKDILLRGRDPESMTKYSAEFTRLDGEVDAIAGKLCRDVSNPEVKIQIQKFQQVHQELGEKYRVGLDVFQKSKGLDTFGVDKLLKGQDRAPTDFIDKVVTSLQNERENHSASLATAAARQTKITIVTTLILFAAVLLLAFKFARDTGLRLEQTGTLLGQIAEGEGDLHTRLPEDSDDELGNIARGFNSFTRKIENIVGSVAETADSIASASKEFSATTQQITANSEETSAQANVVSAATEEINRNLQTVATSTEEMSASISEIAKNASEAAKVAGEALKAAMETNATVTKLGESSAEIGQVIKVITSIAQQTNLLALNATIEAARAGEAGKGFAVVANEVKELAKQTAKATEDIGQKVAAIQTDSKGAVEAISKISVIIGQVNDISATIATAVEEQSATTTEMSRNLTKAAKGSHEVAKNITGVAQAAQSTSSGATHSQKAARQLAQMSTELRELVGQFRVDTNGHVKASRESMSLPKTQLADN